MNVPSIFLGIDPGTGRTGWGVIKTENNGNGFTLEYVAHGCITTDMVDTMHKRLQILHEKLQVIITEYRPQTVIVEQIFFGINTKTAISVSQARGVVMLAIATNDLIMNEYTSGSWKHGISGNGRMEKKDIQMVVRKILHKNSAKLSFNTKDKAFDDAADALAIAIHHAYKLNGVVVEKMDLPGKQPKAIKKVKPAKKAKSAQKSPKKKTTKNKK